MKLWSLDDVKYIFDKKQVTIPRSPSDLALWNSVFRKTTNLAVITLMRLAF